MPIRITNYYPDTISCRWTKTAVQCYYNGLMCSKCTLPDDLKNKCKMKGVVLDLVRKFGKPKKELEWDEEESK